jgi:anti-sigma regulatory factor (Ser/Thr protein kinase)
MPADPAATRSRPGSGAATPEAAFRHELLMYAGGGDGFLEGTLEPVRQALARDAGVLVMVTGARASALREALGDASERVRFADVQALGTNPARSFPLWQDFADECAMQGHEGALGISEAVWPGRSAAELTECQRQESLLNLAFDDAGTWQLLCAYDLDALDDQVIEDAKSAHPLLARDGSAHANETYACDHDAPQPFAGSLPEPASRVQELAFAVATLGRLRHALADWARAWGLGDDGIEELVLAVDELASNSVRHGGGSGTLRCWRDGESLVCEVQDAGYIQAPLIGRRRPEPEACSGRGMWLVNQLCDLVQIRSSPTGSVVRVHKRLT